ncbi:MAG: hypothetical protein WEB05_02595 [Solirubrobacterales bacterium]
MNTANATTGGAFGRSAKMLLLGAIVAIFGVFAMAGPARAAPVSMELDNGLLNLGFAFRGAEILPAPAAIPGNPDADPPIPPTPLPDLWDARDTTDTTNPTAALPVGCLTPALLNLTTSPPSPVGPNPEAPCSPNPLMATVTGDLDGGAVTVEGSVDTGLGTVPGADPPTSWGLPSGFRFPIMIVPNPLDGSPVPVTVASTGDLTGTYDSTTGALTLAGPIEARVLVGLATNPLGSYCALPLTGLTLSTTSNDDYPGVPFTNGFDGEGALTGTYNITADATSVGGADCGTVNSVSKGSGSIWLFNGIAEPPVCPADTTGIPPACEPIPCPTGYSGNEPNCTKLQALIGGARVAGPRNARRARPVVFRVAVRNIGTATLTSGRILVRSRGVRVARRIAAIPAGQTGVTRVRLRFPRVGWHRVVFRVTSQGAGGRTVVKYIKFWR